MDSNVSWHWSWCVRRSSIFLDFLSKNNAMDLSFRRRYSTTLPLRSWICAVKMSRECSIFNRATSSNLMLICSCDILNGPASLCFRILRIFSSSATFAMASIFFCCIYLINRRTSSCEMCDDNPWRSRSKSIVWCKDSTENKEVRHVWLTERLEISAISNSEYFYFISISCWIKFYLEKMREYQIIGSLSFRPANNPTKRSSKRIPNEPFG